MFEKLVVATGNLHKFKEISARLKETPTEAISLRSKGVSLERPEAGENYFENAKIKADEAFEKLQLPALADDSGLEVDALGGAPGIYSDRWVGTDADASMRNKKLLEKLEGRPVVRRGARYICEMVVVDKTGLKYHTRGICEGRIAQSPRGGSGFGYDPIFEVEAAAWETFGELSDQVKSRISHRAIALNKLLSQLRKS